MDVKSKKQLVNDYRKAKKINKSKIRDGKKMKDFRNNDDSILNSLPSGVFDNNESKKKLFEKDEKTNDNVEKKDDNVSINLDESIIDEEEYEEFNDDYFKQEIVK